MTTTDTIAPAASPNPIPPAKAEPPRPTRFEAAPDPRARKPRGPISRFFRSLFSHLLFAGAAVAGVLGYLYHGPILRDVGDTVCAQKMLGQWMSDGSPTRTASPSKPTTTAAETVAPATASSTPKPEAAAPSAATSTAPAAPVAVKSPDATAAPAAPAAATSDQAAVATKPAEPAASPAAPSTTSAPPAAPRAEAPSATTAATPAPTETAALNPQGASANSPEPTVKPAPAAKPAPAEKSAAADPLLDAWADARKAFAEGKPEAVATYQDLARRFPDVPELTGELGNIYFQQGKMKEAADLYYETAQRLIRKGEPGPAACLIDVMRFLDADKAKALEQQTTVPCPATVTR